MPQRSNLLLQMLLQTNGYISLIWSISYFLHMLVWVSAHSVSGDASVSTNLSTFHLLSVGSVVELQWGGHAGGLSAGSVG